MFTCMYEMIINDKALSKLFTWHIKDIVQPINVAGFDTHAHHLIISILKRSLTTSLFTQLTQMRRGFHLLRVMKLHTIHLI